MLSPQALRQAGLAALLVLSGMPSQAQDLVGCQLLDGQLSCVPGVSTDPEAQIRALRQQIAGTISQEDAVEQSIKGLESLELAGEASEGALLQAVADADALAALPASAYHWYRLAPDDSTWLLISTAAGPTYRLQPEDVGREVMLVISVDGGAGRSESTAKPASRRQASPPVGPIRP